MFYKILFNNKRINTKNKKRTKRVFWYAFDLYKLIKVYFNL